MEAGLRVQRVTDRESRGSGGREYVGRGASGDMTMKLDGDAEKEVLSVFSQVDDTVIVSEETGVVGNEDSRFTVVVDPIDGSSNFRRGIPFYCTSVAVAEGRRLADVRFAMVRNLVNGDVYLAEKGRGATKNGRRVRTSGMTKVSESVLGLDVSRARPRTVEALTSLISKVGRQVHFGANALELCLFAEGRMDCFVDVRDRMRIVDFAAAYLICREAGATVQSPDGSELDLELGMEPRFSYVASATTQLQREVLAVIRPALRLL